MPRSTRCSTTSARWAITRPREHSAARRSTRTPAVASSCARPTRSTSWPRSSSRREGRLRRHRRLRWLVLTHLRGGVQEHAAQHHGRAPRHRLSARAGVCLTAARRADQMGQGPGDLDQQCPDQFLRTAKALVSTAAEAVGYSSQESCADLAIEWAWRRIVTPRAVAAERIGRASSPPPVLRRPQHSQQGPVRRQPDLEGLAVHRCLPGRPGAGTHHEHGRHVIFYPDEAGRDPEPIAPDHHVDQPAALRPSRCRRHDVAQHLLRCNDYANCDAVTLDTSYTHTPFTAKVENMMRSIASKIASRTAIPNNSPEVGSSIRRPSPSTRCSRSAPRSRFGTGRQPHQPVSRRDSRRLRVCLSRSEPSAGNGRTGQGLQSPASAARPRE